MKRIEFPGLGNPPRPSWLVARVFTVTLAFANALIAERKRAHRATMKARSPRRNLAEIRALYVLPVDRRLQSDEECEPRSSTTSAPVAGVNSRVPVRFARTLKRALILGAVALAVIALFAPFERAAAQMVDRIKAPNTANEGIAKTLEQQVGADRGDWYTPESSSYIISRDPFRAVRRGRQLFQRKFTLTEGQGSLAGDGRGDIGVNLAIGAGMTDSCAACHGRPRGSAGAGGVVVTRPDSRDAPHLFGLGLKEMLADEITSDLRNVRTHALAAARKGNVRVQLTLVSKGVSYGSLTVLPNGSIDTSGVIGVDPDLRVRPFFAHGGKISIREFIVGALNDEMGLQVVDPELAAAKAGGRMVTESGMILDGTLDRLEGPPATRADEDPDKDGIANEIPRSLVDYLEFYLLNYFKPATYKITHNVKRGRALFDNAGCNSCHIADFTIRRDRRVADVDTVYDADRGLFNNLFATASPLFNSASDGTAHPPLKQANLGAFEVKNIFTDFKRHDLGPGFHERNYDGSIQREFMTTPLWGVGTTAPYGHDGRSINLIEVILRHGGEARHSRDAFERLPDSQQSLMLDFLNSLVLFPPDDTASNLNPGDRSMAGFPQYGHGNIKLPALFNDPPIPSSTETASRFRLICSPPDIRSGQAARGFFPEQISSSHRSRSHRTMILARFRSSGCL